MLKINGIEFNSDDYLLVEMGDIQTAKKRVVETVDIYGANGSYVVHDEGYESAERELVFSVKEFDKISKLRSAFNDFDNILEFDYISNSKYIADFVEMKYARQGKSRWLVTIKLVFDPFRYALDSGVVTLGANGWKLSCLLLSVRKSIFFLSLFFANNSIIEFSLFCTNLFVLGSEPQAIIMLSEILAHFSI